MLCLLLFVVAMGFNCMGADVEYEDIGCFKDRVRSRALPELLHNYRDDSIDWKNDWPNMYRVRHGCASLANQKGYLYFGIQFYGECWSGPNATKTFYKYGKSKRCINGVGKGCANRVYMIVTEDRKNCARKNYHTLTESDRLVINTTKRGYKHDRPLPHGQGWYRFMGQAGNIMSMESRLDFSCNTYFPGWMTGQLPDISDGMVQRQVCFIYKDDYGNSNTCDYNLPTPMQVQNCGHFFIYNLTQTPRGLSRYCSYYKKTLPVDF